MDLIVDFCSELLKKLGVSPSDIIILQIFISNYNTKMIN